MPPADPSSFGLDALIAPLTLVAFICTALGYAAREYRAARQARVAELIVERDEALSNAADISTKLELLREEIAEVKETSNDSYERLYARHNIARRLLMDGTTPVAIEDLP